MTNVTTFCGTHKINQIINAQSENECLLIHAVSGMVRNFLAKLYKLKWAKYFFCYLCTLKRHCFTNCYLLLSLITTQTNVHFRTFIQLFPYVNMLCPYVHKLCRLGRGGRGEGGSPKYDLVNRPIFPTLIFNSNLNPFFKTKSQNLSTPTNISKQKQHPFLF